MNPYKLLVVAFGEGVPALTVIEFDSKEAADRAAELISNFDAGLRIGRVTRVRLYES